MAMFASKAKPWYETLPKPTAADMADYNEALRRAGMTNPGGATPPIVPDERAPMAPSQQISAPTGMFGARPTAELPYNIAGNVKPSFFGEGGTGRTIIGAIGDALSVAGGGRPVYLPLQLQKRQEQRQDARLAQKQESDWQTWVKQQEYLRANPKPVNNDTVADYQFRVETLGKEAADDWLRRSGDPFITANLPDGNFYAGPQSGLTTVMRGGGADKSVPTVSGQQDYDALPSGAQFRDPQGNLRTKR